MHRTLDWEKNKKQKGGRIKKGLLQEIFRGKTIIIGGELNGHASIKVNKCRDVRVGQDDFEEIQNEKDYFGFCHNT